MTAELYGPAFFEGRTHTVIRSADLTVPHLMELIHPKSVLDVGCGQGEWLFSFPPVDVLGVDISAPPGPEFMQWDLTQPLMLDRAFDLVLCLETGEHLPEESADTLVESCVRHAADAIVFGAAVPGQEGTGHINCQPHDYWHAKFLARGFEMHDTIRPLLQDPRISPWYRNNMFLYRRPA